MTKIDPKLKAWDQKDFNRIFDMFQEDENDANKE
jgi:hypothetical protein